MDCRFPEITQDGRGGGLPVFNCRGKKTVSVKMRCYAKEDGLVKTAWNGVALCWIPVAYMNDWTEGKAEVSIPDGIHALHVEFKGEGAVLIRSFRLNI